MSVMFKRFNFNLKCFQISAAASWDVLNFGAQKLRTVMSFYSFLHRLN